MATTMNRWQGNGSDRSRGTSAAHAYYGTVVSIVLLLVCWFVIGHWRELPQIIDSGLAALP
jgi:hypothetical protein